MYPADSPAKEVINFCANNYLGLSSHPKVIQAAREALESHGYGMSSVRFICGTQDIHKELERKISTFLGTDDTILYAACFSRYWAQTTPSSLINSTMPRSSTAFACVKPSATFTATTTWATWRPS